MSDYSFISKPYNNPLYSDPGDGDRWLAEDQAAASRINQKANDGNAAVVKDYVLKGENPRISGERVAHIIPPPKGYDAFEGRVCLGPGLVKNGRGNPRICGRQAVLVLKHFVHTAPKPARVPDLEAAMALDAYGGVGTIVATSPSMGHIVPDPNMPPGDGDDFRCFYHGMTDHKEDLHPDDNGGIIPDNSPKPETPVMGLGNLDLTR